MRSLPPFLRSLLPVAWYGAIGIFFTWPAAIRPVSDLPGAPRTDLWDSLWSFWYFAVRVAAGETPTRVDGILNHPDGGTLWVADPINSVLLLPLIPLVGVAAAWTVAVLGHFVFAGLAAHRLGEAVSGSEAAGWVTGTAYAAAPMLLAHVHNGASEAVGTGWLAWAALRLWRLRESPGRKNLALAAVATALAAVANWYFGVCAFLLLGALVLFGPGRGRLLLAGALAVALVAPVAVLSRSAASAEDNVVGIKTDREVATVRRTIGAADPVGFVMPGDYRSPDFRELSRYGEEYVHCHYLGWVGLLGALASFRRRAGTGPWWLAGIAGATLSLGPVLARFGAPVILTGRLAIPLPYLALEPLPGFDSLSLVWRLAQLAVLAVAVLAGRAVAGSPVVAAVVCALLVAETRWVSPMAGLPETTDAHVAAPIHALVEAPPGALMNFPVAGGRAFLYEQTVHRKPLTGGLNFPNNNASRKVWRAALDHVKDPSADLAAAVSAAARAQGIRYLVVHTDAMARPDMHDAAVKAIRRAYTPLAEGEGIRVYQLW